MRSRLALLTLAVMTAFTPFDRAAADEHPKTPAEHPAAAGEQVKGGEHPTAVGDIIAVATGAGQFKTLVQAVAAAGLVETLQGKGPFTLFAPTDEAFAKLPEGTLANLLKPENKDTLVAVLTYHVVPEILAAGSIKTMQVKTVGGRKLSLEVGASGVVAGGAKVVKTDLAASNGVIHVIDAVMVPGAPTTEDTAPAEAEDPKKAKPKDHPGH
ncbi:MAG: fasciclin domain-containing protein [Candidatus Eisenbacteria bacterium]|nr:fasciclin domain-containing protein [Candidatus Eisenbacteria bacterium]